MERIRIVERVQGGGNYFSAPKKLHFISSGCKILDLALGGGWAEGRIANIVGDKSSGKTLLCIEAAANFALKYKSAPIFYRESEASFDPEYAAALGMPINRVDFGADPIDTVEDLFLDLEWVLAKIKSPCLYILDSLDGLSDEAELERDIGAGTYGSNKAKKMSELFRRLTKKMGGARVTFLVVSQVRSKLGMTVGRQTTRSGGRALDFYASQVIYLKQKGQITKTVKGLKRPIGIKINANVDKNKVSLPFREADFDIRFGYGIDDMSASLEWLKSAKGLKSVGVAEIDIKKYANANMEKEPKERKEELDRINSAVERCWYSIEQGFLPARRKYA